MILLRHASAGARHTWTGDDRLRPLDPHGLLQAERLAPLLAPFRPNAIITSPYLRCVETVAPLAAALGLVVTEDERLAENAVADDVLRFLRAAPPSGVFCTHRNIVDGVLARPLKKGVAAYVEPRSLELLGTIKPIVVI